tara:strand:+ start:1778 stop:2347 length:570 start_codon:yes stop_codon:yes gene_type:complete
MTPLPLGILALAGVTGGGPAYELLESTTLSSGASSVTFSGLSAYATDYKHLQIRAVTQINKTTDTIENVFVRLNGDQAANYAYHELSGNGSSVNSISSSGSSFMLVRNSTISQFNADYSAPVVMDFLDFASSSKTTTMRGLGGSNAGNESQISFSSSLWNNTAAVTSIEVYTSGYSFNSGSRFSLIGIR